jgi:hypothetical protein
VRYQANEALGLYEPEAGAAGHSKTRD